MSDTTESRIARFYELKSRGFPCLRSATFSQHEDREGVFGQRFLLVFGHDMNQMEEALHVEFHGVRNLRLTQSSWAVVSLDNLQIHQGSLKAGVSSPYFVFDGEQEQVVQFECSDVWVWVTPSTR